MTASQSTADVPIAGWRERVDLPEWGLHGVRAKLESSKEPMMAFEVDEL